MRSVTILAAVLVPLLLTACSADPADPEDPLAGDWHLTRTQTSVTEGCEDLTVGSVDVTLDPGAEDEIVLDEFQSSGANAGGIDGTHVEFGAAAMPFSGSDTLIIGWDVDLVDDQLVGTATAQGDGPRINCHWTWDVVGTRR
jgi:hypothetical protein